MTTNVAQRSAKPFGWPRGARTAVQLLAEDEQTDVEIAAAIRVHVTTVWRWQQYPEFAAEQERLAQQHQRRIQQRMARYPIARKERRVASLDSDFAKTDQIIDERAAYYVSHYPNVPGGSTGLIMMQQKISPTGDVVIEHVEDVPLMRERRDLGKQAAQELGQVSEGKGGETTIVVPVQVNVDSNAGAVSIAERAYIAALRGERVVLGEAVYEAQSPDPGADAV